MSFLEQHFRPMQEPPKRVLDSSTAFFPDYGYQTPRSFVQALRHSVNTYEMPHLVMVIGKPKSGKMHTVWDIASKIHVPASIVLWGNCFSIAKIKGRIPSESLYGEFNDAHMNIITEEFQALIKQALTNNQGKNNLIFVKAPSTTGAYIDGAFFGRNRGITALAKVAHREDPFAGLEYKHAWVAEIASPEVEIQGNAVRTKLETVVNDPTEIARGLENSGEVILTPTHKVTEADKKELIYYISESANPGVSDEIKVLTNNLAVEMYKKGRFRLSDHSFYWDEAAAGYRFLNPMDEMRATALVLREVLEGNFGIKRNVFLGRMNPVHNITLDLRMNIQNVARAYYDIEGIKNK